MNTQELVQISDCTLLAAEDHYELSFREKIELCRLIDKLGVSTIDLCPIRRNKTDRLLVKSICSAVKNASVAVPVDIMDEESVRIAWEALKEAVNPCLQIAVPVSSVQMEYMLHLKADAMVRKIRQTVGECRKLTDNVELVAKDATRSDPDFLLRLIEAAVEEGVRKVTLCDTAGAMMPDEIYDWLNGIRTSVSDAGVVFGFFCNGDLNLADACAVSAIRAGAREIKAICCAGSAISLANIVRIISMKGGAFGVRTSVGTEQIRRITGQVDSICRATGSKRTHLSRTVKNRTATGS